MRGGAFRWLGFLGVVLGSVGLVVWLQGSHAPEPTQENQQLKRDASPPALSASAPRTMPLLPSESPSPKAEGKTIPPEAREKLEVLSEILQSKNDNDPRLDRELRELTPDTRRLFESRYQELANEKRNQKGTIAFLLARNPETPEDFQFLGAVLGESPCLSLEDCTRVSGNPMSPDDHHWDAGTETTLHYPQLVTLRSLAGLLDRGGLSVSRRMAIVSILERAKSSPNPRVAQLSRELLEKRR